MVGENGTYDVVIIGAGVVGCAIARELSRYELKIGVLEKEPDVGFGTSCRNSGVVHSGINYKPGTRRAVLDVRGNSMMDKICSELKTPIKRIGKLTVALSENDLPGLYKQRDQGLANGVPGMELLDNEAMQKIQPGIEGILGLWTPSSGIISPYGLTIALAENAHTNGVDFCLEHRVDGIKRNEAKNIFEVEASDLSDGGRKKFFRARVLINSAGLHSDEVSRMAGVGGGVIWACRGEYYVLDKRLDGSLKTLIYPVPGPNDPGLGIHLTPTVDGNILIGPSASYIPDEDREDYRATAKIMQSLRMEGQRLLPGLASGDFIRNFSGNRPKQTPPEVGGNADFTIEETESPGFIHLQGIESPGLTSSPAIAVEVRGIVERRLEMKKRTNFIAERRGFVGHFSHLPREARMDMIHAEPEYGEIICRCEGVTKKEIRDAIENPLGARTLMSIKYRARAMMGRCQGGFCIPRITRMLRDEYGYAPEDYRFRGGGAYMFTGVVRRRGASE
ncbi:MAG: NAD(P)/FAD-dependent oxidoreductase [Synergistaceae bacterium]|jgi:glycerol-3-phosphate dehydrogenase|nr:NAD(P)/FAD-dependent oxidoreductase [Synergistaceae bacterium]